MKHFNKHLLISLLLLLAACEEKLPEPTQNGSNTIACKVNGKAWIADRGASFSMKKFSLWYSYLYPPHKRMILSFNRVTENENSSVQLALENIRERGTQHFSFDTNPAPDDMLYKNHAMYREYKPSQARYVTNSRHTGSVTFTRVDTVNRIIAGIFEFTAESLDGSGQTVRVTDGRFDINYGKQ